MASLVKNGAYYGLIWTEGKRRTRESLQTDNKSTARQMKSALEYARQINRHDPFAKKWYDNSALREMILTEQWGQIYQMGKPKGSIPLGEAAKEYIDYKSRTPGEWDSPRTVDRYSSKINHFVRHTGPGTPVSDITDHHLTAFTRRGDLSPFTIQSDVRIIKTFLKYFRERGYRDQQIRMSGPNPQKEIPDFIYPDQLKKICLYKIDKEMEQVGGYLKESRCQWWHPLFWILLSQTGMRPSELIALQLDHINGYEIHVRKGTVGKSQAAKRRVPVLGRPGRQCLDVLVDPKARERDEMMRDSRYLFGRSSESSQKRCSSEFTEAIQAVLDIDFTMRDLRNCWAMWFLTREDSKDPYLLGYQLKRIMGHSSSQMSDRYLDALPYDPDVERLHRW